MTRETNFPPELLSATIEVRVGYFHRTVITHPEMNRIKREILEWMRFPSERRIALIVGPAGTGKTTLGKLMHKELLSSNHEEVINDPGFIPTFMMELIAPERWSFDWIDNYDRMIQIMHEPLPERRAAFTVPEYYVDQDGKLTIIPDTTLRRLRRAVESSLKNRRVLLAILDEAHHLLKFSSGEKRKKDQMDCIKSLVNVTSSRFAMLGGYELLDLATLSPQLSRRIVPFHFSRYKPIKSGFARFQKVVNYFETHLPLANPSNLEKHLEELMVGSLGCVGILHPWLGRALRLVIEDGRDSLTLTDLEESIASAYQLNVIADEIYDGEQKYKKLITEMSEKRAAITHIKARSTAPPASPDSKEPQEKKTGSTVKPGTRNATRDPVGPKPK